LSALKEQVGRKRVLIVVQNLPVPFDRRVWLEATTLSKNGYRVSVICPKMRGFNASRETIEDIDIHRYTLPIDAQGKLGFVLEFLWCFLATSLLSLKVQIAGRGFDVLHVCNPPETYWPLAWFWRAFGKRFIFDHHDLSPEMFAVKFERPATRAEGGALFKALLFLERMTFKAAQIVITTNESHKRIAVARGGKRPEDVFIVRSGPDLSRFKVYESDAQWRKDKPYLIAYLGEICKQDGVDHLVRAVKILRDELKRSDVHCIFMGGGPHQQAIADYAVEIGVQELCTFTGRVSDEDLCRVLSSADIGVDPDPKNAWSDQSTMNKVVEYMFFGLPVLSYDLHETRVSAGEAAMFVTANDERALAEGIIALLDNPTHRKRLGAAGYARVREVLAWNYSVAPLLAAYRAVFGDRSAAVAASETASVEAEP
jgi:glycosyltransferase involved in cell wall biosynthesis